MSRRSCSSSVYSSSVPDLQHETILLNNKLYYWNFIYLPLQCLCIFYAFASSTHNLCSKCLRHSLHPLPLSSTSLPEVENARLRTLAIVSQSFATDRQRPATFLARARSWCSSGQRNCGAMVCQCVCTVRVSDSVLFSRLHSSTMLQVYSAIFEHNNKQNVAHITIIKIM